MAAIDERVAVIRRLLNEHWGRYRLVCEQEFSTTYYQHDEEAHVNIRTEFLTECGKAEILRDDIVAYAIRSYKAGVEKFGEPLSALQIRQAIRLRRQREEKKNVSA